MGRCYLNVLYSPTVCCPSAVAKVLSPMCPLSDITHKSAGHRPWLPLLSVRRLNIKAISHHKTAPNQIAKFYCIAPCFLIGPCRPLFSHSPSSANPLAPRTLILKQKLCRGAESQSAGLSSDSLALECRGLCFYNMSHKFR